MRSGGRRVVEPADLSGLTDVCLGGTDADHLLSHALRWAGTDETGGRSALDRNAERLRSVASEIVLNESPPNIYASLRGVAFQTIFPLDMQRLKLVINFQTSPRIEVINFEQTDALRLLTIFVKAVDRQRKLRLGWGHSVVVGL